MAVKLFAPWIRGRSTGAITLKAYTDNQGNVAALGRLSTTTFPLNCVVMELAVLLEDLQVKLDLHWIPRDLNDEADKLSKGVHDGFDQAKRLQVSPGDLKWNLLPQLMEVGLKFHEETCAERARLKAGKRTQPGTGAKAKRGKRLRDREPW